jgi:lauroyl/myristoyl acyltransferase
VRRLKVPIVFAASYRTDTPWRWRLSVPRVLFPDELQGLGAEGVVGRINAELERMILAAPEQYFWLHDRYRKAPPAPAAPTPPPPSPPVDAGEGADAASSSPSGHLADGPS